MLLCERLSGMIIRRIENYFYFLLGAIFLFIGLVLQSLPDNYISDIKVFGANWIPWLNSFIDWSPLFFFIIGAAAIGKAYNYKPDIRPPSENND